MLFNSDYKINNVKLDDEERYIIADIVNPKVNIIIGNVYYPNTISESKIFSDKLYTNFLEFQFNKPAALSAIMGDLNMCFGKSDCLNRGERQGEDLIAKQVKINTEAGGLVDTFRTKHPEGGYTWNRGSCYSRLDYIFLSEEKVINITKLTIDWEFDKSDHAALSCGIKLDKEIIRGRGIVKLNTKLLDDDGNRLEKEHQLRILLEQIPDYWNAHTKLEYVKVAVRSAFANVATIDNKSKKVEIEILEMQINSMVNKKIDIIKEGLNDEDKLSKVDLAIDELKVELDNKRKIHEEEVLFKSGVKWYEEGEKSNKYFLGLLKIRQKQTEISQIEDNDKTYYNQEGITKCITNFYSKLYKKITTDSNVDNTFFDNCPKLSKESREDLDRNITLEVLRITLFSCKDLSPGPDGISYSIYKKFWPILGTFIIKAWDYA